MDPIQQFIAALQQLGIDFNEQDPRFRRVLTQRTAADRPIIAQALGDTPMDDVAEQAINERIWLDAAKQFLTESGQLGAVQRQDIASRTGERLRTDQSLTPEQRTGLTGQLDRLGRMGQQETERVSQGFESSQGVGGTAEEFLRSAGSTFGRLASGPGRLALKAIPGEFGEQPARELEAALAGLAPEGVPDPVTEFAGGLAGSVPAFSAVAAAPVIKGAAPIAGAAGSIISALGSKLFPRAAQALRPVVGGGTVPEAAKAVARSAVPATAGTAAELAVVDPEAFAGDPKASLLASLGFGAGRMAGAGVMGSRIGRPVPRTVDPFSPPGIKRPQFNPEQKALLQQQGALEPTAQDFALTAERLPEGGIPESPMQIPPIPGGEIPAFARGTKEVPQGPSSFMAEAVREGTQRPDPMMAEAPLDIRPRPSIAGMDIHSQTRRLLEDLTKTREEIRLQGLQREYEETLASFNALQQRRGSTSLTEPQGAELASMGEHIDRLIGSIEQARAAVKGGAPSPGARFPGPGRPKPRRPKRGPSPEE